jgi:uncharacterized protein YqeY
MSLKEKLNQEMKAALKGREKTRLSTIRLIQDAVKKKEIDQGREELDDDGIIKVISTMVRKAEEAIELFKKGGRQDLVGEETRQVDVLKSFLPQQLSMKEIESLIDEAIEEAKAVDTGDLGKVMKILMPKVSGKSDGKTVNQMVRERLSG